MGRGKPESFEYCSVKLAELGGFADLKVELGVLCVSNFAKQAIHVSRMPFQIIAYC